MPSARKCSNARLMAAVKCSRRKTLVRDTSKKSISKCTPLDSLEIPLILYRFSEPVVRVERKNVLKTTKILRIHFSSSFSATSIEKSFHSRDKTLATNIDTLFFRFPVNLCWRPCWIFQRINLASAKFDARSTSNNEHIPRKTDFDAHFSNFPVILLLASVLNFLVHQTTTSLRGYIFATCHIERQFSERTHCALDLSG